MQVIKVNHVILHILAGRNDIADQISVVGHLNAERVLDGPYGGQGMHCRADTANSLRPDPGFTRIAATKDQLNASKHGHRAPGIGDSAAIHFGFDAQMAFNTSHRIHYDWRHTVLLPLLLTFRSVVGFYLLGAGCGPHAVSNRAGNAMNNGPPGDRRRNTDANLPSGDICTKAGHIRETFIKRGFRLPEVVTAAADAAMSGFHRPARAVVKANGRAVKCCLRAFASLLVEAPAAAVSLVSPLLHVSAGIEVSAPLALIVNDSSISEEWPLVLVDRRQLAECEVVDENRSRIRRVLWASTEIDDLGLWNGL